MNSSGYAWADVLAAIRRLGLGNARVVRARVEAWRDESAPHGWRVRYGYQEMNPGKPGKDAETARLGDQGVTFSIPIEQKARPGLVGALRIEARPWR